VTTDELESVERCEWASARGDRCLREPGHRHNKHVVYRSTQVSPRKAALWLYEVDDTDTGQVMTHVDLAGKEPSENEVAALVQYLDFMRSKET
jgi:hypothetical protein